MEGKKLIKERCVRLGKHLPPVPLTILMSLFSLWYALKLKEKQKITSGRVALTLLLLAPSLHLDHY